MVLGTPLGPWTQTDSIGKILLADIHTLGHLQIEVDMCLGNSYVQAYFDGLLKHMKINECFVLFVTKQS